MGLLVVRIFPLFSFWINTDVSPLGYGGMCSSGKCQPGSLLDTAKVPQAIT